MCTAPLNECAQIRRKYGAGKGNRTPILSLEGCCTTIVLYPHQGAGVYR